MHAPDFRLYHGNDLEVLAELLAHALRTPADAQSPLVPDTILIPQAAMKRWLVKHLAERHGIAANLEFLAPGEFVGRVLARNLGPEDAASIDPERLLWRLYGVLRDPASRTHPALARSLAAWLADADADADAGKAWSLARAMGDTFVKYQAWRRDWLLHWDRGGAPDDWQAELWRRARGTLRHRAAAIDDFLRGFAAPDAPLPQGLPPRVFAFACINVSPDVLHVLAASARATVLHFYLPTPTRRYWGDLESLRARVARGADEAFEPGENALLARWGRAGRDFVATLFTDPALGVRDVEAYVQPRAAARRRDALLHRLRHDLLDRQPASGTPLPLSALDTDRSLQVHACHTRLREVQVLHDQLRALLEADPTLEPRDIAVMAPDIDAYAPHVTAVFGAAQGTPRFIPWTLADGSALATQPLADLLLRVLDLPQARLGANEVLDLLSLPMVARRYDMDPAQLDALRRWVGAAGARWGLDDAHRERLGAPRDDAFTWRFALERLLLGHALGSDDPIAGIVPWPELEGSPLLALDSLLRLLRTLDDLAHELAQPHPAPEWRRLLAGALDALTRLDGGERDDERARERIDAELKALVDAVADAGLDDALPREVVRAHLQARLGEADARQPLLSGGVSVCRMVPMRLIPFRVIALLGLNDGDYPRHDAGAGLNRLIEALDTPGQRRTGDRSTRDDDRLLFLQLLSAADDVLYLSYLGRDAIDGSPREPSALVGELLDEAARHFAEPTDARSRLVLWHALQPFAPPPDDDARRIAFDPAWHAAQRGAAAFEPAPPFSAGPLASEALPATIAFDDLLRFLRDPPRAFLRQRLGLRLPDADARLSEDEPFVGADGIEQAALRDRVFALLCERGDIDDDTLCARLQAEARLPPAAAGRLRLRQLRATATPVANALRQWRGTEAAHTLAFDLDLGPQRLHGRLDGMHPHGLLRAKAALPNGRDWLRWQLEALLLSALGESRQVIAFAALKNDAPVEPYPLPRHDAAQARAALRWLIALMQRGLTEPLPFRPASAWEWVHAEAEGKDGRDAAEPRWSDRHGGGDGHDAATALALRGAAPFDDEAATQRFATLARQIFAALGQARVPESPA